MDATASRAQLPPPVAALMREDRPVAALKELARGRGVTVEFITRRHGEDHAPRWTAQLEWRDRVESYTASTKQDAITVVAERIMQRESQPEQSLEERVADLERQVAELRALVRGK